MDGADVTSYRIPALVSSVAVVLAAFSIFIWAMVKQGNGGPLLTDPEAVSGIGRLSGSTLGWVMVRCITSGIGGWAGGVCVASFKTLSILRANAAF